jgi:outer membrane protein TolC
MLAMKLLLFLVFLPHLLWAKDYHVQALIAEALKQAPQLRALNASTEISQSQLQQAKMLANPVLAIQRGSMQVGAEWAPATELTLAQPIPWPGRRSSLIASRNFQLELSKLDEIEGNLLIAHRTLILAAQLSLLAEIEKHHEERRQRFARIQNFLATRPLASPRQQVDKNLVEAHIKATEALMRAISIQKYRCFEDLRILTGIEIGDQVKFNWLSLPPIGEINLYLRELDSGIRSKRLATTKALAQYRIEEARYQARPDLIAGINYRREDISPGTNFYHAQVSLVIPLVDRGQHSTQLARADLRRTEALEELQLKEMHAQVRYLHASLESLNQTLRLFPFSYLKSLSSQSIRSDEAFRKGQIDVMTLLQTDSLNHDMVDKVFSIRFEYLTHKSELDLLLGKNPEFN